MAFHLCNVLQPGSWVISVRYIATQVSFLNTPPARAKFFNFYGQPNARLNADQSIYAKGEKGMLISVLSWTFNVALFGAPNSHMRELRSVWVDRTINVSRWKNFNNKLSSEWSGITIYVRTIISAAGLLLIHISQL